MTKLSDQIKVPHNSISCFIGRICKEPSDSFANDGILYVDTFDLGNFYIKKNDDKY